MGERCKYNGGHNYNRDLVDYVADKEVITICPEVLAGLPTPREPVELVDGHVLDKMGNFTMICLKKELSVVSMRFLANKLT